MPSTQYVWGVRIYLRDSLTQDTDIGLYTASPGALSELRWVEHAYDGTDSWGLTWKPGILVRDAFSSISEGADLRKSGAAALSEEFTVTVCNTEKLVHNISSGGINLVGCRIDIVEFEFDTATLDQVSRVVGTGVCEQPRWTETDFTIPAREPSYKRNATMGTLIDENNGPDSDNATMGECIPLTFGELRPDELRGSSDTYAKLIRTSKNQRDWKYDQVNYGLFAAIPIAEASGTPPVPYRILCAAGSTGRYPSCPIVRTYGFEEAPTEYGIKFTWASNSALWQKWDGSDWVLAPLIETVTCDLLIGKYVHVVDGKSSGKYRRIENARCYLAIDPSVIYVKLYECFEETLAFDATARATDQSWVEIIGIDREYEADKWPCKSFTDESGVETSSPLYLYSYSEQSSARGTVVVGEVVLPVTERPKDFIRLPQYAYTEIAGGDKNSIEINATLFKDDPDEMFAYHFIPVQSLDPYVEANLSELNGEGTLGGWSGYVACPAPFYTPSSSDFFPTYRRIENVQELGSRTAVSDKSLATYYGYSGEYAFIETSRPRVALMFFFVPPSISRKVSFDKCYLGIHSRAERSEGYTKDELSGHDEKLVVRWRKWIGNALDISGWGDAVSTVNPQLVHPWTEDFVSDGAPSFASLPDYYSGADSGSKYFYYENVADGVGMFGLSRYEIDGIDSYEKYLSIEKVFVGFRSWLQINYGTGSDEKHFRFCIHELCMILEKKISIKECIFSPMRGRIYNDTWGTRRTSANLISNPIDVLEHVLRLQNWSETGETMPSAGWGHAYGITAKIDTSTSYGGFDHASLGSLKGASCARQVLGIEQSATREMVDSLCRDFFLCQYKRTYTTTPAEAGQEQVAYLLNDTAATETITLDDVIGDIGQVQEPKIEDIFCEPYVRFCWNPAREKFDRVISVKNSGAATWDASYTPGFSASEGEAFWGLCHDMWDRYGVVTPPPTYMVDKYWIYSYTEAKQYLERWISWMQLRRLNLSVGYVKGRAWHVAMKVELTLPHQTNGTAVECMIEHVSKSKNDNRVELDLILLDQVSTESMYLKESYLTKTERGASGYADQDEDVQTKTERGGTGTNDWEEQN
jgi:hypothetical protein